jgi:hypothetical protein
MGFGNIGRDARFRVSQLDLKVATFGEQAGYQYADLAGAKYEDVLHETTPEKQKPPGERWGYGAHCANVPARFPHAPKLLITQETFAAPQCCVA